MRGLLHDQVIVANLEDTAQSPSTAALVPESTCVAATRKLSPLGVKPGVARLFVLVVVVTPAILFATSFAAGTRTHSHQKQNPKVLTSAVQLHEPAAGATNDVRVHLTGTITYYDPARGLLFLHDSSGGVYVRTSKPYPLHTGDLISVDGIPSATSHSEIASDPEIHVLKAANQGAGSQASWFSLQHFIEGMFGLGVLALGAAGWATVLRWRVANQNAWIDRSVTLARERSRILELISTNHSLEEVLQEICTSTMKLVPGTDCSFQLDIAGQPNESVDSDSPVALAKKTLFESPLKDADDRIVGNIAVSRRENHAVASNCEEVYRVLGELSALALRQSLLYRGLVHHSTHDPLTDLPNRRLYETRLNDVLSEAERSGNQMALIYIDINRFKHVNDQHGHKIGDLYLQQISARLRGHLRPDDMLARVGGDEFVVIAPFLEGFDRVFALTARLQRCFHDPFELDGVSVDGSASFGFARYPEHGRTAEDLTRHADHAMYVAKHESRMSEEEHSLSMITANDLELAFFNYRYRLAYQPQFSASGRLTGLEALIRLDHPILGLLTPDAFISVAEKHPIIIDIGAWALRCAVQDAKLWGLDKGEEVSIAVNVSARQLEEPGYARSVLTCLKQNDFPPERLEIELVERSLMFSGENVLEQLVHLRSAGVRISLDDFGTEQSCLSILHKLPIDTIKLDRSFIQAMDNEPNVLPIIQAIVSMARALDKRVVAEAVEHVGVVPALMKMGKMDFQGYLLSRPIPAEFVPSLIEGWRSGIDMPRAFHDAGAQSSQQLTLHGMPRTKIA
jgi:diguanylate cyclase (GGDEF)-like protein